MTDAKGIVVGSSIPLPPGARIDLSDREHFKFQRDAKTDQLYVGSPVVGRISSESSMRLTRRMVDAEGRFAGVVVVSLDPQMLARIYAALEVGAGSGLALVGDDGLVRSSSGSYSALVGKPFPAADLVAPVFSGGSAVSSRDGVDTAVVVHRIEGFPLAIAAALPGIATQDAFATTASNYRIGAVITSILIAMATLGAAIRHARYQSGMWRMARFDSLTGLPNRVRVQEVLYKIFAQPPEKRRFALHIVDLDGFKFVNDTYGHLVGDALLKKIADRLTAAVGPSGRIVGRLGGDEFAIVQPVDDFATEAKALAERVIERLSNPCRIEGIDVAVGASVGYADLRVNGSTASELMQAADLALYEAKSSGRGAARAYNPDLLCQMRERTALETGLRRAIENEEFVLYYQPIVSAANGTTVGLEALVRWNHPERGLVPPNDFIGMAEETGLIIPIGAWVLRQACQDIARLSTDLRVAVNCSVKQFNGAGIVGAVRDALDRSGLAPDRLEIEITESMLINETQSVSRQLAELREIGCHISLDDFGTGYSSLSYLARYPIDKIKIDRAFISTLGRSRQAQAVVKAIVQLAQAFSMETVAEGVEDDEQRSILREIGCYEMQGYFFDRPKPMGKIAFAGRVIEGTKELEVA